MYKKLPHISVVVPAYNEAKYISNCLLSLQRQSYSKERIEILVIDNNSTDETVEIARKFGVKVLVEKEQGYIFALRKGLLSAKGDIIAITDADTTVSQNWLSLINDLFKNEMVVGATGFIHYVGKSNFIDGLSSWLYYLFLTVNLAFSKPHTTGSNFAIRRQALNKIHGVDIRYKIGGDVDLGMQLKEVGKVLLVRNLQVYSSLRRWKRTSFLEELHKYASAYIFTIWLRKPPRGILTPVR